MIFSIDPIHYTGGIITGFQLLFTNFRCHLWCYFSIAILSPNSAYYNLMSMGFPSNVFVYQCRHTGFSAHPPCYTNIPSESPVTRSCIN